VLPLVGDELARRLEDAGWAFNVSWLEGARALPGNPLGIEIERFGGAVAPVRPGVPDLDFMNRVCGLYPQDAAQVGAILDFYRARGVRPWFELAPGTGFDRLAGTLADAGAAQIGFHTVVYGRPEPRPAPPAVRVRRVGPDEAAHFAELRLAGSEVPEEVRQQESKPLLDWPSRPDLRLYVASVDGSDAAAAVLAVSDGVGYLATAATLPAFRGRGCQAALIAARVADAAELGCGLVGSQAAFGSPSLRNLERAGLRVAYTKAVWRVRATNPEFKS
jgi:GNAT superfamily N-acetyltransferase